jgi:hypothetical protein
MSIKSKVLAAAATLALVGGVGTAGVLTTAGTASAATPSCGPACVNLFSYQFGTHRSPNFTVDVFRQGERAGQPIILFRTSNFDPALDWTFAVQGTVADFFAAGLVSATTALHYGCDAATTGFAGGTCFTPATATTRASGTFPNLNAFEIEYAPFGVDSGLCMGVAATAFNDEGVTLQPCGVSSKTVWIVDSFDQGTGVPTPVFRNTPFANLPLINGSNTNFSKPFVLTYPGNAFPTDKPRPQIVVTNLTGFQQPGTAGIILPVINSINSSQLWGGFQGVVH